MKISFDTPPENSFIVKHMKLLMAVIMISCTLLCGLYLRYIWVKNQRTEEQKAITLTESLASQYNPKDVASLSGSQEDLDNPEYFEVKYNLSKLVETTNLIRSAYLIDERNGIMIILADSELTDSPDYSPPGHLYPEATDNVWESYRSGNTVLIDSADDRRGTWISTLVPITNPESGEVIAVFGLDFSGSYYSSRLQKQMIPEVISVSLFMPLIFSLYYVWYHYYKLRALRDKKALDEALYTSVFDQAPIGIAIVDNKKFVSESGIGKVTMNPMFENILGRTKPELANSEWSNITHPEDLEEDLDLFEQFKTGKIDGYTMKKRFLKPDGSYVWTNMKVTHFLDRLRDNPMHLCLIDDISKEKEFEDSLVESERSKSVLLSNLPGMAYRCSYDKDWTMRFVSAGSVALTGYSPDDLVDNKAISFNELIAPEYREESRKEWMRAITDRVPFKFEHEIIMANGERKWVVGLGQGVYNEKGDTESLEGIVLDISDRKEMENWLKHYYEYDSDTGLKNINSLRNQVNEDATKHLNMKRAIILINLSTVQRLNMAYGYTYVRELIKNIAKILKQFTSKKCVLYKTHDNRFVFYILGYSDENELWELSRKFKDALWEILKAERVGSGIGILEIDDSEKHDASKLSKKALIASFKAINLEENEIGICFYNSEMEAQIQHEEDIKQELTKIIDNEDGANLYLQYQPILDLSTGRICDFEALARMNSDKLGFIPPLDFIPIAEMTKQIVPIGWLIFHQAFNFLKKLGNMGFDEIGVAINVSAIQFSKNNFAEHLFEMIDEMQVSPTKIHIEITESVFASDYNQINSILDELRDHGLQVFIDDFGTGYSSLARERELNVDCLKIDKSFIDKIMVTQYDKEITGDIIAMAHKCGHFVIAEGVEYEQQRQYLLNNLCDKIQGYLISKPLDEEAAIEMLRKR